MSTLKAMQILVTPFQQNCTLLWDEATMAATLVDPGGDVDRITAAIARVGCQVQNILITHGHLDHAGGAAAAKRALGVKVEGPHIADLPLLEAIPRQATQYGIQGLESVTPDRWLTEGETVSIGGEEFAVLHCPGHTPGHVVFVSAALRLAIVGDVLFQGSVGRTDFPYGDPAALIAAIEDKLLPLGDDIAFLCGHGPGSSFGQERRANPFLRGR
jgi:glyoxylase-like metal-dependent hydrolase (beta-lactamase superfamily II)